MRTRTGLHIHRRAVPVGAAALLVAGAATAHDFWIEPQVFAAAPGTRVGLAPRQAAGRRRRNEGLTEVLAHRERSGQAMRAGTERYSRHAKALVSDVCAHPVSTGLAQRVLGLRLEIVPVGDPVAPPVGEPLGVRLLFDGRPLAGAQVRRVSLGAAPRADERGMTDSQGVAWFSSAHAGPWMLAAVWSRPLAPPAPVAYETFFASFTYASRTGEVPACELPK